MRVTRQSIGISFSFLAFCFVVFYLSGTLLKLEKVQDGYNQLGPIANLGQHLQVERNRRMFIYCACDSNMFDFSKRLMLRRVAEVLPITAEFILSSDDCIARYNFATKEPKELTMKKVYLERIYHFAGEPINCGRIFNFSRGNHAIPLSTPKKHSVYNHWQHGVFWGGHESVDPTAQSHIATLDEYKTNVSWLTIGAHGETFWAEYYPTSEIIDLYTYRSRANPVEGLVLHFPTILDWANTMYSHQLNLIPFDNSFSLKTSNTSKQVFGRHPFVSSHSLNATLQQREAQMRDFCVMVPLVTTLKPFYHLDAIVRKVVFNLLNEHRLQQNRSPCLQPSDRTKNFTMANGTVWTPSVTVQNILRQKASSKNIPGIMYKHFRFVIGMESQLEDGMLTEKPLAPMMAGAVPIYCGAWDTRKYLNEKRFISCQQQIQKEHINFMRSFRLNSGGILRKLRRPEDPNVTDMSPVPQIVNETSLHLMGPKTFAAILDWATALLRSRVMACVKQIDALDQNLDQYVSMLREPFFNGNTVNAAWDGSVQAIGLLKVLRRLNSPILRGLEREVDGLDTTGVDVFDPIELDDVIRSRKIFNTSAIQNFARSISEDK